MEKNINNYLGRKNPNSNPILWKDESGSHICYASKNCLILASEPDWVPRTIYADEKAIEIIDQIDLSKDRKKILLAQGTTIKILDFNFKYIDNIWKQTWDIQLAQPLKHISVSASLKYVITFGEYDRHPKLWSKSPNNEWEFQYLVHSSHICYAFWGTSENGFDRLYTVSQNKCLRIWSRSLINERASANSSFSVFEQLFFPTTTIENFSALPKNKSQRISNMFLLSPATSVPSDIAENDKIGFEDTLCILFESGSMVGYQIKNESPFRPNKVIEYFPCIEPNSFIRNPLNNSLFSVASLLNDTNGYILLYDIRGQLFLYSLNISYSEADNQMYRIQFNNFILNAVFDGHNSEIVSTSKNHYLNSYTDVKKEIHPIFYTVDSQGNIFVWNAVSFSKALFYSLELDILHNDDLQIHWSINSNELIFINRKEFFLYSFSAETNSWTLSHKPNELKNNVDELLLVPDTINSNFISSQKSEFKSGNSYTIIFLNKGEASAEIYRVEYLQNSTIETKFMGFQQLTLGHKKVEFDFAFSTYHNSLNLPGGQKDVLFYTFLQKNSVFIGWELANSENRLRAQPKCAYNLSWNNMIYNMQSGINNEILFISEFSDKKNGQQRSIFSVPLPFVDYFSIDNKELYSESEKEHTPKTGIEPLFISRVCSNASDMLIQPGNHEALLSVLNNIDTIDIVYTTHLKSSRPKLYNIGTLSLGKLESRLRNFMFLDIRKSAFVTDNKIHIMIFNRNASVKKTPVLQEIKGQTENIKDIKIKEDISISNTTVDSQDSGSINQLNEGNLNNEAKASESGITNPSCTFESVNKQYESIGTNLLKRFT
ncbi:hypothetical protein BB560_001787 [Smittium megazygosporum]|uniref:RAVE complex protein Rav1 C-terminal domain-containing protein n=1 Tax=Smittium megazygosporum TaxID=133381 RepID=A0A2T9ZGL0_9FUNG|nr:hypothetical protein BB560_001787 [Smittium megazygosporum]